MQYKEQVIMLKIFGLLGAIFSLIAILAPWGWGVSTWGSVGVFHIGLFTSGIPQAIFLGAVMIVLFVFTILLTVMGFLTLKDLEQKGIKKFLTLFIIGLIGMILYIVAASVMGTAFGGGLFIGGFGIGFIMIIIAWVMYLIGYILGRTLNVLTTPAPAGYQQPAYQQPAQPMQAYVHQQPPTQPQQPPQPAPQPETVKPAKGTKTTKTADAGQFCPQCGAKLEAGAKFCPGCGNKIQ
jgi:hypothetical protein